MHNQDIKPKFHALARQWNCDYRTAKKYYYRKHLSPQQATLPKQQRMSILDPYKPMIDEKIRQGITNIHSIYLFIQKEKGYPGKYSTVRNYASSNIQNQKHKATIRIETSPGLSAQVDGKEKMTLYTRAGEAITFNLFLFVLGYSRYKFVKLTRNRKQETLFSCLSECFRTIGGIPKEIWFDNMKTVVDRSRSQFHKAVFHSTFHQFSKDMHFQPIACRAFRPQTKGKVESLAKLTERLRAYNYEFDDWGDLERIVSQFRISINEEISQATDYAPIELWQIEKEHLQPINESLIESYTGNAFWRKVSQESMVMYQGNKYSVPIEYIGKKVQIRLLETYIQIYYNDNVIKIHPLSKEKYNYEASDAKEILKSDVFIDKTEEEIETFIEQNMRLYDAIE